MKHLKSLLAAVGAALPATAWAHPAHDNTVLHAVLHMLQTNGIWVGLLFAVVVWLLHSQAKRAFVAKESDHDSR